MAAAAPSLEATEAWRRARFLASDSDLRGSEEQTKVSYQTGGNSSDSDLIRGEQWAGRECAGALRTEGKGRF